MVLVWRYWKFCYLVGMLSADGDAAVEARVNLDNL